MHALRWLQHVCFIKVGVCDDSSPKRHLCQRYLGTRVEPAVGPMSCLTGLRSEELLCLSQSFSVLYYDVVFYYDVIYNNNDPKTGDVTIMTSYVSFDST